MAANMGGMGMAMGQPNFNPGANLNQARMDAFNAKQGQMKQQNLDQAKLAKDKADEGKVKADMEKAKQSEVLQDRIK